jgi:hypothetical protein
MGFAIGAAATATAAAIALLVSIDLEMTANLLSISSTFFEQFLRQ